MPDSPHIVAVVADEIEKRPTTDFTFMAYADPDDRRDRAWGTLLKGLPWGIQEGAPSWKIHLAKAGGNKIVCASDAGVDEGVSDLRRILDPHWVPACIILTEAAHLKDLENACAHWQHTLKVYRVAGTLMTAGNPYPG